MRGLDVSRRGLMAGALAAGAALRLGRAAAQGGPGGPVLVGRGRHRAAQPQPRDRRLERRVLRGEQGDRAAGRDDLRGGGLDAAARDRLGGLARRARDPLHPARGRAPGTTASPFTSADVAFSALQVWKPLQNLGREVFKASGGGRDAGRAHGDLPLRRADAVPAHPQRAAGADRRAAAPPLRGDRHRRQPGQHAGSSGPGRSASSSTGPGEFYRLERNPAYWERGPPGARRHRLPRAARPRPRSRRRSRRTRSSSRPSRRCRSPTSRASARCRASRVIPERLRGHHLPADRRDQPPPQGARRPAGAPRHRARDRPPLRRRHDLPRLRQALDRPDPAFRQAVPCAAERGRRPSIREPRERAPRRGRLSARRRTEPASSSASCRRPGSSRRASSATICARRCGPSASTRRSSTTTPPRITRAVYTDHAFDLAVGSPGLPQRPGDLDHDPLPGRPAAGRAVLEPVRLRQPGHERASSPGPPRRSTTASACGSTASSRRSPPRTCR